MLYIMFLCMLYTILLLCPKHNHLAVKKNTRKSSCLGFDRIL